MHQFLCFESKFPKYFAFTLGRYFVPAILGPVYLMWMLFGSFFMFFNFYRLDVHPKKTLVSH